MPRSRRASTWIAVAATVSVMVGASGRARGQAPTKLTLGQSCSGSLSGTYSYDLYTVEPGPAGGLELARGFKGLGGEIHAEEEDEEEVTHEGTTGGGG